MVDDGKYAIIKYRFLWVIGVFGLLASVAYTVYSGDWYYWLTSYLYFRVLWFFTNQIGLHKYFAHRTFKTGKARHNFLAWITVLGGVGSPFTWTLHHRHHHKHSDTALDLHSPKNGQLLSITGLWAIKNIEWWVNVKGVKTIPKDLLRDKTVMYIHNNYYKIWSILFFASLLIDYKFCLFFIMQPVGLNLLHGAITNYFNHRKCWGSYRNFETTDNSYNNKLIHWYLLGEGLHNNHHGDPGNYNNAVKDNEFDLSGWIIKKYFITDGKT